MPYISAPGVLGNGLKIAYSVSSPISWIQVPDIMVFDKMFELVSPRIDTTVSGVSIKTTIAGIPDAPELSFTKLSDPNPSTGVAEETIRALQLAGTIVYWRWERPTNTARTLFRGEVFQGYVLSFGPSAPVTDKQTVKVVLSYSGGYVIDSTAGASLIS